MLPSTARWRPAPRCSRGRATRACDLQPGSSSASCQPRRDDARDTRRLGRPPLARRPPHDRRRARRLGPREDILVRPHQLDGHTIGPSRVRPSPHTGSVLRVGQAAFLPQAGEADAEQAAQGRGDDTGHLVAGVGGSAIGRAHQEAERGGVGDGPVEDGAARNVELGADVAGVLTLGGFGDVLEDWSVAILVEGVDEAVAAVEVAVERRRADTYLAGHRSHRQVVDALRLMRCAKLRRGCRRGVRRASGPGEIRPWARRPERWTGLLRHVRS